MFLLLHPLDGGYDGREYCKMAIGLALLFAWIKVCEYELLKGDSFYGLYLHGSKVISLTEDPSDKNKMIRNFHFLSFLIVDAIVIYAIVKYSWLFN